MAAAAASISPNFLVVPGQVIAVVSSSSSGEENGEDSFLRGHGTYIRYDENEPGGVGSSSRSRVLVAAVTGTVERVNKLISVNTVASMQYTGQVGDLIVGRIVSVGTNRWKVDLAAKTGTLRMAILPLTAIHLPGGAQRIRTAEDARSMRALLQEGDVVSAEVHKINNADGSLQLHTRSARYGKCENGCVVAVSPALIPRRRNHYTVSYMNQFQVLWGCNGMIWMQRKFENMTDEDNNNNNNSNDNINTNVTGSALELAELQEQRKKDHANMPYSTEERNNLARLRNSILCLQRTLSMISPEAVEQVYQTSLAQKVSPAKMLYPDMIIRLTAHTREGAT